MTTFTRGFISSARRSGLEGAINLTQKRQWFAANVTQYGFINLEYLFSQRIVTIQVETIQTAVAESLAEYSRQVNGLMSMMVEQTTDYKRRYQLPSAGSLQPLDNNGVPRPVVPSGFYDVGFPIYGAGTAWGTDRISRAVMTVGDANRFTMDAMTRDGDWMRRHILAALFTNTTYTYTDEAYGALTVQTLANADATLYTRKNGVASTDSHFLFQAAAIANATNPYPTMYTSLDEHPSNRGPYTAYISTSLVATTVALTNFRDINDTSVGWADTVSLSKFAFDKNVTSKDEFTNGIGDRVIGYVDGMRVVEWSALPAGYIVYHSASANDVLGMRQYPQPELQGLFPEFWNVNGNHMESRLIRYAGFAVQNRIGAGVMLIGAGAYSVPSGFLAPLPA